MCVFVILAFCTIGIIFHKSLVVVVIMVKGAFLLIVRVRRIWRMIVIVRERFNWE